MWRMLNHRRWVPGNWGARQYSSGGLPGDVGGVVDRIPVRARAAHHRGANLAGVVREARVAGLDGIQEVRIWRDRRGLFVRAVPGEHQRDVARLLRRDASGHRDRVEGDHRARRGTRAANVADAD